MSKTLDNVTSDVETILGDTSNATWSKAELQSYIKEGFAEFCLKTKCLWKRDTTTLADVAGQGTYTLPSDLYEIERYTWNDLKLEPLVPEELELADPAYRTTQGPVYGYIVHGDGIGTLRKVRVPDSTGVQTNALECERRGATLSSGSTVLDIPDRYVKYVRFFALSRAYERDGPGQNLKAAEHYMGRFDQGVGRVRKRKSATQKARVGSFGGSRQIPTIPSPRLPWRYGRTRY